MLNLPDVRKRVKRPARIEKTRNPDFLRWLVMQVHKEDEVLDIGCGDKWYHPFLDCKSVTSVDVWKNAEPDFLVDLEKESLPFPERFFDVVLLLDVVEHLELSAGLKIIAQSKRIARKKVILLTPLKWDENDWHQEDDFHYSNPYRKHKALWRAKDFESWYRISLKCFKREETFLGVWYVH